MALSENDITTKDATISANKIYADARRMLFTEQKSAQQTVDQLVAQGLTEDTANQVVQEIMQEAMEETETAHAGQAKRDMLFGAMWCVGGLIATLGNFGYVFWGAIAFGAIQFIKGAINLNR